MKRGIRTVQRATIGTISLRLILLALMSPFAAKADCPTNETEVVDLSTWSPYYYGPFDNIRANWVLSQSNTVATQTANADASILLSPFTLQNDEMNGSWRVDTLNDDDFIGFVFGYQDPQHFYLFDWKQADQNNPPRGFSERGMTVKRISADSTLTAPDLGGSIPADTNRVYILYHNTIPWEDLTDYEFRLQFTPGQFTITVSQGTTVLATIPISDDTYTSGLFGFYNFSQNLVRYSGFTRQVLPPQPTISISSESVIEGDTGTTNMVFSIRLSATNCQPTVVDYVITSGTATFGQDYTATTSGTLIFAPGETNQSITATVFGDSISESNETFFVTLSNPRGGTLATPRGTGTIVDNDPFPVLQISDVAVLEGNAGSTPAIFSLTLSARSERRIQVRYRTSPGTATSNVDYTSVGALIVVFAPGQTSAVVSVPVIGDTVLEPDETFSLCLETPINVLLTTECGTGTILNDDVNQPPAVTLTAPGPQPCFLLPTNIVVRAEAQDPDGISRVEFYDNTTKLGETNAPPYDLLWTNVPAGTHTLTAVAFDNLGAAATSAPVVISGSFPSILSIDDRSVLEGNSGTNMTFTVTLDPPACRAVTVHVATLNGSASAGSDYAALATNLTFQPGETSRTVVVPIIGDTRLEPDETFQVCLQSPSSATLARSCGLGTIINDDVNLAPTVRLINPVDGAVFLTPPGLVTIDAEADDPDGFVQEVKFYAGGSLVGTDTNRPFGTLWTQSLPGEYVLVAIATDEHGATGTSAPVRITIRQCIGIIDATPLTNQTRCVCEEVIFSTIVSSTEPVTFVWRFEGEVLPGETNNLLVLRSLKLHQAGNYSVEIHSLCSSITLSATLTLQGRGLQNPVSFTNAARITIADNANASPYPAPLLVNCVPGAIKHLKVTLDGLSHNYPDDIDILLVNPGGQSIKLMSDAGGTSANRLTDLRLEFADTAVLPLPDTARIASDIYLPTDYAPTEIFPAPAPNASPATNLVQLLGTNVNGTWSLYVRDDTGGDAGSIARGWSITIEQDIPRPKLYSLIVLPDGQLRIALGGLPRVTHMLETSADLVTWTPVVWAAPDAAGVLAVDLHPPSAEHQFFRANCCP